MKALTNIKKAPFEIGQLLASNTKICGYLVDDTTNPQPATKNFQDLLNDKYITIYPPIHDAELDKYTRNTYITILLDNINLHAVDDNYSITGNIFVITDVNHILLDNNRNRLLELADEVYQTLEDKKIKSSGAIHVVSITYTMIDTFSAGYRINFTFSDQQNGSVMF